MRKMYNLKRSFLIEYVRTKTNDISFEDINILLNFMKKNNFIIVYQFYLLKKLMIQDFIKISKEFF